MPIVLGIIFGIIVIGTLSITLVIVIKGERELDKPETSKMQSGKK